MFNIAVVSVLVSCFFVFVFSDNMIAPGVWEVLMVEECDNPEQYEYQVKVDRRPMNRTHAHFLSWLDFEVPLDSQVGCKVKICKYVDGGCKDYHTVTDSDCLGLARKQAEQNVDKACAMMGVECKDHIDAGHYEIDGFVCDYCEWPCKSVIGKFGIEVQLMDRLGVVKGCITSNVEFREHNDDEEICARCLEED